jgi:hypothetical protein
MIKRWFDFSNAGLKLMISPMVNYTLEPRDHPETILQAVLNPVYETASVLARDLS